jgi:Sigma-70 factor, region 1.2
MGRLATADWSVTAGPGVTGYLWQIQRFPMLEPHEEYMLAKRWREHGGGAIASAARNHSPLALSITTSTSGSLDLIVNDLPRFLKCGGRSWGWHRCGQPQPVLVVYRHDEAALAREIEPMKIVNLGFGDHG